MPQLPTLDYEYTDREVTDTFAGYNHKLKIGAGEFYDTENLTSAYYPLLAERKKRGLVKQLTAPGGLLGKEELAKLADEDPVTEVCCHFCDNKYRFTSDELRELIKRI